MRFCAPYSDFLVGDSVQNRAEIHIFGAIAQQGAEIEELLAVGEDLRDDAAHRENVRAPATVDIPQLKPTGCRRAGREGGFRRCSREDSCW